MDISGEKVFIRCEKQFLMLHGKALSPGDVMEIPKETLKEIRHLILDRVVTVHSRNPDAVRTAREDALKVAREERLNPPPKPSVIDYKGLKKAELLAMAKENGISVKSNENKASIIEKLSQGG
tara:strand:- start:1568 stop:1936 length:369 start_codon:yes stop_codon:yes gene_type:complete